MNTAPLFSADCCDETDLASDAQDLAAELLQSLRFAELACDDDAVARIEAELAAL